MTTINVKDAAGSTVAVAKVADTGTTTDSASLPVAFSTEGKAQLGALTETAPASDTASSGINGRLQRIAQNITTQTAAAIPAGTNVIGKTSIDQTTVGTTDSVTVKASAGIGSLTETAPASDTASSGLNGRLQRVAQNLTTVNTTLTTTNTQLPSTLAGVASATITRPANTTAYTALDIIGTAMTFATGLTSGQHAVITHASVEYDVAAIPSGMTTFRLHLYDVTPPSAPADNAAFDLPSGDRSAYLGYIDLDGTMLDLGATCYTQKRNENHQIKLNGSANVFGLLQTIGGFTPAGNSEVLVVKLRLIGS